MRRSGPAVKRWAPAVVIVAAGWLASPAVVPVYDGVGFPDQPYRYVTGSPAPTAMSASAPAPGGVSSALQGQSGESGPQVKVDLAAGTFRLPAGGTVTLTASPVQAGPVPGNGSLDGNVYRFSAPGATVQSAQAQGFVYLRAAVMTRPDPVVEFRATPTAPWTPLPTTRVGTDTLGAPFRALGDYAIVRLPGSTPLSSGGGIGSTRIAVLVGGLLLLLLTVVLLRRPREHD